MRSNSRLNKLKKFIILSKYNGHIKVKMLGFKGKWIAELTSITENVNNFEKECIIIFAYKLFEEIQDNYSIEVSNKVLKYRLNNTNYAEVFGSPWNLERK